MKKPSKPKMREVYLHITLRGRMKVNALTYQALRDAKGGPVDDCMVDIDWQEAMNLDAEVEMEE